MPVLPDIHRDTNGGAGLFILENISRKWKPAKADTVKCRLDKGFIFGTALESLKKLIKFYVR